MQATPSTSEYIGIFCLPTPCSTPVVACTMVNGRIVSALRERMRPVVIISSRGIVYSRLMISVESSDMPIAHGKPIRLPIRRPSMQVWFISSGCLRICAAEIAGTSPMQMAVAMEVGTLISVTAQPVSMPYSFVAACGANPAAASLRGIIAESI